MNVLIVGAHGRIARDAIPMFLEHDEVRLTLFLRDASRMGDVAASDRVTLFDGDATDADALADAMAEQDVVYANLAGDLPRQAHALVAAMRRADVKRLIFISSMGVYGEVPGETHGAALDPYREATRIVEESGLDYTVVRPAWLNDDAEIAYGTTLKGEPFVNADAYVSRRSVADLVVRCATQGRAIGRSIGVHAAERGRNP